MRPVVHYMMGGVTPTSTARRRSRVCTPRARSPASASTAPTGWARTRCRSCSSSARGRDAPRPSTRSQHAANGHGAAVTTQAQRRGAAARPTLFARRAGTRADGRHPRRDADRRWRRARASIASGDALATPPRRCGTLQERRVRACASRTTARTFNTERVAALELAFMLDVAEAIVNCRAATRGVARRAPAHGFPGARRPAVPGALAGVTATPTARAAWSICR